MSVNQLLPTITLTDADGNPVTIELRDGKLVLDVIDTELRRTLERLIDGDKTVNQGSAVSPADAWPVTLYDPATNQPIGTPAQPLSTTAADVVGPSTILSGAGQALEIPLMGQSTCVFNVTQYSLAANSVAQFQVSSDGGNTWIIFQALTFFAGVPVIATGATSTLQYIIPCQGFNRARLVLAAYTGGTITVQARAGGASCPITYIGGSLPAGNNILGTTLLPRAPLCVTATGLAGAGVTATLPAVGGAFHNIVKIQIIRFAAALLVAGTTPVLVTTTNLPGSPVFSIDASPAAQGTTAEQSVEPTIPIQSSVANTATTIVAPATTNVIWRINVWYYTGA